MTVSPTFNSAQKCIMKAAISFFIMGFLPSIKRVEAVAVLSEPNNGSRKIRLDEDFLKYIRSFQDNLQWNPGSPSQEQKTGPFQEPPVMDKPGLFFPDDLNPWTPWSTCLDKVETRSRGPLEMAKLMKCGHLECLQTRPCQPSSSSALLQWSTWSQWTGCMPEGGGNLARTRERQCRGAPARSDSGANPPLSRFLSSPSCPGLAIDRLACENQLRLFDNSQWTNWSPWSKCEHESQFRTRSCMGSARCTGASHETQICSIPYISGPDRTWGQSNPCLNSIPFSFRNCRLMPSSNDRSWRPPYRRRWTD